jgi:trk system potassium uptake protein TrkA
MTKKQVRIVIAGAGNVGLHVASDLRSRGHDVTIIEQNGALVDQLRDQYDVNWIVGDACELGTLDACVLASADVVVAATGDDEDNLVVSLLAKQEFAVPRVIARVNHPDNSWLFTESWGVDVSVSMPHLLTSLVEEAVSVGDIVRLMSLEQGRASIVEITLGDGSPAAGSTVGELELPPDSSLIAIVREGHVISARNETPLSVGDEVLALSSPEAESQLQKIFTGDA